MKSTGIQLVEAAARGFAEGLIRSAAPSGPGHGPVVLDSAGPLEFDGEVGEALTGLAAVDALFADDLRPAEGVRVRFEVILGPLMLLSDGDRAVEVRADDAGRAAVDGRFLSEGFAIVVAELVDDPRVSVYFRGHSGGMAHQLSLSADPVFSVDPGEVTARIVALDRNDRPVTGARLSFEGHAADRLASTEGTVEEIGDGVYRGRFQTDVAGTWNLVARDLDDFVAAGTCVTLVSGPPARITLLGGRDPRTEQPFGELVLRARSEDRFGNGLDPGRLVVSVGDDPVAALAPSGLEARVPVRLSGYGSVEVTLTDADSEVQETATVPFAAAWLQDPGFVTTGSRFTTGVFWIPERDRPVTEATVRIAFDPALVSFQGFEGAAGGEPALEAGAILEGSSVSISIAGERPVAAEEFPDGVFVGECTWECLGEGETCFTVVALMSPPTDPWELCPIQKGLERNRRCLCVNVIHPPKDNVALTQGRKAAKQVETIISSKKNVKTCCPVIEVKIKEHEMTPDEWKTVNRAIGGDQRISGLADARALAQTGIGAKDRCINLYVLPFDDGISKGTTQMGGPTSVLATDAMTAPLKDGGDPRAGAHELGHALGLSAGHVKDRKNLNAEARPVGDELTEDQCKTIFETIDQYAC